MRTKDAAAIELNDVHRRFGDNEVLRGLDLAVRPGEIHALLGRNGSGKTTAVRILLGFLAPHRGGSAILGIDSRSLSPEDRGRIGYVSEDHRLEGGLRVGELVGFEAATRSRFRRDEALAAVKRCGLPVSARVSQLSRGQRAQLALIVAVASDPAVLICDDPALGLDVVMRRELLDVMIELLSGQGFAVLFSSHFLTDVERVADRVSILSEGQLIVDTRLDHLKARVETRRWRAHDGAATPPQVPALLRKSRCLDGWDLVLLDLDAPSREALAASGTLSPDRVVPALEELFIGLTRREGERIFSAAELAVGAEAPPSREAM